MTIKKIFLFILASLASYLLMGYDYPVVPYTFATRDIISSSKTNANNQAWLTGVTAGTKKVNFAEIYINGSRLSDFSKNLYGTSLYIGGNTAINSSRAFYPVNMYANTGLLALDSSGNGNFVSLKISDSTVIDSSKNFDGVTYKVSGVTTIASDKVYYGKNELHVPGQYATLNLAIAYANSNSGSYYNIVLDSNSTVTTVSIPTNIRSLIFRAEAHVTINGTLTFAKQNIDSSPHYIFKGDGIVSGEPLNSESYAEWWGAVGDNSTDCTDAIQKSINFHHNTVLFNKPYKITDSILVTGGKKLHGSNTTIIRQFTDNIPIIIIRGERAHIYDLALVFNIMQSNEYGNGIHIQRLYESVIERIRIQYAYRGIQCEFYSPTDNSDVTANYIYSTSIRDVRIAEYKNYGLYLSSVNANNTGCIIDNIYINNYDSDTPTANDKRTATGGALFKSFNESSVRQINIEHTINANCIVITGCDTFTLQSFHIEGCDNTGNYNGFIDIVASNLSIDGGFILNNDVTVTNLYSLFRLTTSGKVHIKNVKEDGNTISGGGAGRYTYSGAYSNTVAVWIDSLTYDSIYNTNGFVTPTTIAEPPMLRKLNDTLYYQVINGRKEFYLTAMPTTGTFAIGDRVINTLSTIAEAGVSPNKYILYGWMRITASSANVLNTDWLELRQLTGN